MQDPERKHPEQPGSESQQPQSTQPNAPQKRPPSITLNEEEAGKYLTPGDSVDKIIAGIEEQIARAGGHVKEISRPDGSKTTEYVLADRTVTLAIESTREGVVRELEVALTKNDENSRKLLDKLKPYQASFHERKLDDKQRAFWPARWLGSQPIRAIYNPSGPDLKIIFTNDPETTIPEGFVATGNFHFADTGKPRKSGKPGQLRISLSTIFGSNKRIQWPNKIDFNGHGTYVTVVASGSTDFANEI